MQIYICHPLHYVFWQYSTVIKEIRLRSRKSDKITRPAELRLAKRILKNGEVDVKKFQTKYNQSRERK